MIINLKKLRTERGISQKQLAEAIGNSQQSVNKYENHGVEPNLDTLVRIADFFDTSVDYLIGHTGIRRKIEPTHEYALNEEEASFVEYIRKLNRKQKDCVHILLRSYIE